MSNIPKYKTNVKIIYNMTIEKVWRDHGMYNVTKLWKVTKNEKIYRIKLKLLIHNLKKDLWTVYINDEPKYITPRHVIKHPHLSITDYNKIINADLSYPILIYNDNGDLDVLDGLHRLSKLYLMKRKTAKIRIITKEMLEKARI